MQFKSYFVGFFFHLSGVIRNVQVVTSHHSPIKMRIDKHTLACSQIGIGPIECEGAASTIFRWVGKVYRCFIMVLKHFARRLDSISQLALALDDAIKQTWQFKAQIFQSIKHSSQLSVQHQAIPRFNYRTSNRRKSWQQNCQNYLNQRDF